MNQKQEKIFPADCDPTLQLEETFAEGLSKENQ